MDWTKQIGLFALILVIQVLLFNQLQLWGLCHPYIYILCLLMMPIRLPHSVDMFIGAIVGLIMDICCNSMGIHMAACILLMFARPYFLGFFISDRDRLNEQISLHSIGIEAFTKYAILLTLLHHLSVFVLGAWSWSHIGFVLLETLISSFITIIVVVGYNILKYK